MASLIEMEDFMFRMFKSLAVGAVMGATAFGASTAVLALTVPGTFTTEPSVLVFNQKLTNGAVDVAYANIPSKGYLVVMGSDAQGMPQGAPIGSASINAGDHRNVKVKLTGEAKTGDKLWVSMSLDSDNKPGYDAAGDKPLWTGKLPAGHMFVVQ